MKTLHTFKQYCVSTRFKLKWYLLGAILDRLAKNSCYETNRTSIWTYFDMSEIEVEEEYRDAITALLMTP